VTEGKALLLEPVLEIGTENASLHDTTRHDTWSVWRTGKRSERVDQQDGV
jgi:hypothetical protein